MVPLLALLGVGSLVGCSAGGADAAHEASLPALTPDEVQARLAAADGKFFAFDANEREVFDAGHVPGAKWVPFDGVTADLLPPDKSASLVFYCANEH